MKQKDYILIGATAIFSAIISFVISTIFISPSSGRMISAEKVEPITTEFISLPKDYFNPESVNPTQLIRISPEATGNPFVQ